MDRARAGNFFPLGIDGEKVSTDEYFANEHDGGRRRVREVYFSVPDVERRKELISLQRRLDQAIEQQSDEDLFRTETAVTQARRASRHLPWERAAVIAVGCVALGYYFKGIVGAIAGAVGGLFLAQGTVSNRRAQLLAALDQLEREVADLKKARQIAALHPEYFNEIEAVRGEEDREFGQQMAQWNVLAYERQQKLNGA
jgi:hypothetical protein